MLVILFLSHVYYASQLDIVSYPLVALCGMTVTLLISSISFVFSFFVWPCSLAVPVLAGWVYGFVVLCPGTPEGSTGSCSGFKASQKTGNQLKVSSDRLD